MSTRFCAECGKQVPPGAWGELCPHCLLLRGAADVVPFVDALLGVVGDYELQEEIARGGMGVVYRAWQKSLKRHVALKMMLVGQHATEEQVRRFKAEAIAGGVLHHPNIVGVHEVGSHESLPYIVMDLVDGPSLSRLLKEGPLPVARAAAYLKTIAEAIHFAHSRGILHRDLKPSNVLIDSSDQPRVMDFGLAKNLATDSSLTATGAVQGSPSYMPPEQATGDRRKVGVRSDVYSLGAMLYHLLTGRPPFVAQTIAVTLQQVETAEPLAPRLLNSSVPRDLETICFKCLEKDPERRYATAGELAEELDRFLKDEPIHARPISRPEKAWRWCRRNPLAASFAGTVCVALAVSLWLLVLVNEAKNKQVELTKDARQSNLEKDAAAKRVLRMVEDNLAGIWANSAKPDLEIISEDVAALSNLAILPVTNQPTAVRWKMGAVTDEDPVGRVRQFGLLISNIESNASRLLEREVRVDLRLYKFQQDFGRDLCSGVVDIGRLGARQYLTLRRSNPGLVVLAMPTNSFKEGIMFSRSDSSIRKLVDVRGRAVAFGDTNSTISFWAQIKLAELGINAASLARYDYLDSTLDFADEVLNVGLSNAVRKIGYLHSHAKVIEGVLDGRYDAGVANLKAFLSFKDQGLVAIPDSQFTSSRNVFVARPGFDPDAAKVFTETMVNLQGYWLQRLPDGSMGYEAAKPSAYANEERWLDRVWSVFPYKAPNQ